MSARQSALTRAGIGENRRARVGRVGGRALLYALMVLFVVVVAFPFYWMVATSLKPKTELYILPPTLIPREWTLANYADLFLLTNFPYFYRNSIVVALSATVLSVAFGTLAAYALTRFRYPGFRLYMRLILFVYMMPSILLVIPLYVLAAQIGLVDTLLALIIANATFTLPFTIWLLRSYFATIPVELEDAARMDGANRLQALVHVVLPIALPGIIATSIFAFTGAWNEFLYALVFITTDELRTLPVGMQSWIGKDSQMDVWSMLLAGAVLITAPVLAFYGLIQRNLVVDLSAGGSKGG